MEIKYFGFIILFVTSFLCLNVNGAVNTCSNLKSNAPSVYTDCTSFITNSGTCCYMSIITANGTNTYCALIYGSYIRPSAMLAFQNGVGALNGSVIRCAASYISTTIVAIFFFIIVLF